jgi:transketolase
LALLRNGPSALVLSRQALPAIRKTGGSNLSENGAYIIVENDSADLTFVASGSEVPLAIDLSSKLALNARIVSVPCVERFMKMPEEYRNKILQGRKVFLEASRAAIMHQLRLRLDDITIGLHTFGQSGKSEELITKLFINPESLKKILL